jgi:hypothetical protein
MGITSNQAQAQTPFTGNAASFWNANTFTANQYAQCVVNFSTLTTNTHAVGPTVRGSSSGYYRFVLNGNNVASNLSLAKVVGGVFTDISSGGATVTAASGDLLRLEVIGTQLTAYYNGVQKFQVTDSSLSTGAPGVAGFDAAASPTAGATVWEGGNLLWTRQGTVIPVIGQGSQEPSVLYEANPQILTANSDGKIFKMWFMNGWTTTTIYYAESNDGINWTEYGSNPAISDGANNPGHGSVVHIGSTYYGYYDTDTSINSTISRWTSPNGVTGWVKSGVVLSEGGGGAWDSGGVFNPTVQVINGTWNMIYEGRLTTPYSVGLATSPDGITWTKYASNPIMTKGSGSADSGKTFPILDGSTYYYIAHGSPSSNLPSDLYLWASPALTGAWAQSSKNPIYERVISNEGPNLPLAGQIADPCLIEVNGTSYLFYDATSVQASGNFVIKLATAPFSNLQILGMIFGQNIIYGNVGVAGASVFYSGPASGFVFSDVNGNYVIPVQTNGTYTVTPSLSGSVFSPASQIAVVNSVDVAQSSFTPAPAPSGAYSVPDCRVAPAGPNASRVLNGTLIYDVQTSSNPAIPPTDSRVSKPVDSRQSANIPTNSRTPGTYGPGE